MYWWGFIIYFAFIIAVLVVVLVLEKKNRENTILEATDPKIILRDIAVYMASFYIFYFLTVYSLNLVVQRPFSFSQVFNPDEFNFKTTSGILCFLQFLFVSVFSFPLLVGLSNRDSVIADFCFTTWLVHFIVVSSYIGEFPASYAWWIAYLLNLILPIIITCAVNFKFLILSKPTVYSLKEDGNIQLEYNK